MVGELRPQTIREAMQLPGPDYALFLAVHEVGHLVAGIATGDRRADDCAVSLGPATAAYPALTWETPAVLLTSLHGGLLAQVRWLHRQELWTPRRARAVKDGAAHDREAIRAVGLHWRESAKARERAQVLLAEHWPGLLAAATRLVTADRITVAEVRAVLEG
ncbi:hypothetical protein [Streptacidiphilus sp. EB129]|jgi:hypothetical protein|uniref:hypothetical protein n=1 Tax=Streptacidiphilus sp. EB129 TaxID=3156262 RepID=UPI003512ECDA